MTMMHHSRQPHAAADTGLLAQPRPDGRWHDDRAQAMHDALLEHDIETCGLTLSAAISRVQKILSLGSQLELGNESWTAIAVTLNEHASEAEDAGHEALYQTMLTVMEQADKAAGRGR